MASTTIITPFPSSLAMICSYMSSGIEDGMLPARKSTSPSPSSSSFFISSSTLSLLITGPAPLISVPSIDFSFRLILETPSLIRMNSDFTPISCNLRIISSPTNPAVNPSAVFSIPRFIRTVETLIPFPPGSISSELVLFVSPSLKSSTETM